MSNLILYPTENGGLDPGAVVKESVTTQVELRCTGTARESPAVQTECRSTLVMLAFLFSPLSFS